MSRSLVAFLTGLIVAVSAVNDTVFMYDYPNYFEDAMKLSVNTSLNVGHGMLSRYETDDMIIVNETHAVTLGEWSNSTLEKRFDFSSAGVGLAGYYYFFGHQEVQNIMVGCQGLCWGELCHSIACLPQLIKFSMGNIFFFGLEEFIKYAMETTGGILMELNES